MLYDWITARGQVELNFDRVMYSDLMRLQMDLAVGCFVDETGSANTSYIDFRALNVLNVKTLDAEGKDDL